MKKITFVVILLVVTLLIFKTVSTAHAVSDSTASRIAPVQQHKLTYKLECGEKTCKMLVNLDLPYDTFSPAEVFWRHSIGFGRFSKEVKASTDYTFEVKKRPQTVGLKARVYGTTITKYFFISPTK